MAQQRLPMHKIRDVLRLSAVGLSKRQIAASLGIGPTAAGECLRRAREAGVGGYDGHETADRSKEMNNAPSGPPMCGATFDSWRSLRAAHGLHLSLDPNLKY